MFQGNYGNICSPYYGEDDSVREGVRYKMTSYLLECCVDSTESALEAARGGADRLELCTGLVIGGVTPGPALFEEIRAQCDLPIDRKSVV